MMHTLGDACSWPLQPVCDPPLQAMCATQLTVRLYPGVRVQHVCAWDVLLPQLPFKSKATVLGMT